jgi:hypothetical protein
MHDLTAKRTLVKSPPELWSELSELERLATHLGAFGEIKITKLEPEHTVAWEGESASGTVSIEPSGWGTKVTLTAQLEGEEPVAEEAAAAVAEPPFAQSPATPEEPAEVEDAVPAEEPPAVEEPAASEEPVIEAPAMPVETSPMPVQAEPERRRGFLGWLFRKRTSAQVTMSGALERTGTEAEAHGPGAKERAAEESAMDQPMAEGPAIAEPAVEEPAIADLVVEESAIAELVVEELPAEEPVIEEPALQEPAIEEPAAEEPATEDPAVEDPAADEAPRAGLDPEHAQAVLDEVLDALGSAHHRPFSRG